MGFLTSLFGGSENLVITILLALGIVLVLIVLGVWALKLLFNATGNVGRGRNKRLIVSDSVAVDPKRKLLLIRRDNVEHLVMTGGPQDLVIETGITPPAEPVPAARPNRRPQLAVRNSKPPVKSKPDSVVETPAPALRPVMTDKPQDSAERSTPLGPPEIAAVPPQRRSTSLRHTGLLRSANRIEPALHPQPSTDKPEIEQPEEADSDTESVQSDELEESNIETPIDEQEDIGDDDSASEQTDEPKSKDETETVS